MSKSNFIKDRRVNLGMTMKDLADLVGVSEATISRWESGDIANMKRDRIFRLSKALRVSPISLLGWGDDEEEQVIFSASIALKEWVKKNPCTPSGRRLFILMDHSNIPYKELYEKYRVTEDTINDWINDNLVPSQQVIDSILHYYHIQREDLFPESELIASFQRFTISVSSHEKEVILAYRSQPEMQDAVDRLLQIHAAQAAAKNA